MSQLHGALMEMRRKLRLQDEYRVPDRRSFYTEKCEASQSFLLILQIEFGRVRPPIACKA